MKSLLKLTAFKLALLIGLAFCALHFVWRAADPHIFPFPELSLLDAKALDIKFKRRGPEASSGKVVVAAIDEKSIQRFGLWPWKREVMARSIKNLSDAGALAIGIDIAFSDPDRSSPHLVVNRLVDEIVARTGEGEADGARLLEGLASRAPKGLEGDLERAREASRRDAERLAELREVAVAGRLEDPDRLLADKLHASPQAVLSVMGLTGDDVGTIPADTLRQGEKALERFFLRELYDRDSRVADSEGNLVRDWSPAFSSKVSEIEVIERLDSVQPPLPVVAEAIHHLGLMDAKQDEDGTIRRYAMVRRLGDRMLPSLALATVAVALDATIAPFTSQVVPGGLDGVGLMRGDKADGLRLEIPIDPWSGLYLINYPGPARGSFEGSRLYDELSLAEVAEGTFDKKRVEGKVVLVGVTAVGTHDQRVTPFDSFVPGIYTHAAVVDSILSGRAFGQGAWYAMVEMALLLGLALLFGLLIPRFRIRWQIAFMAGGLVAYLLLDLYLFRRGVVLSTVMPLLEMISLAFGMVLFSYISVDREKRQVRTAFQYYLTKSVMEEMLKNPDKLKLGGDKREVSVFFSDIRGFTSISERLPPEELVRMLNEYLTPMTEIVFQHQGTLDKYMGDAIMAIWGAPLPQDDHALRACRAAVEMLEALDKLRARWREQGRPDIDIGIGVNSGPASVGNMGSAMRFDYTVMGDNVNLGSRLEGTNKEYGTRCIISEYTFALVKGQVAARELGSVRVKGKKLPVVIYELRSIGAPSAADQRVIAAFEAGVASYRARDWDGAEAHLREVLEAWPGDGPSGHYLDDIELKRREPPPEGWDGVFEMKTK